DNTRNIGQGAAQVTNRARSRQDALRLRSRVHAPRLGEVDQLRTLFTNKRPTTPVVATPRIRRNLRSSGQAGRDANSVGRLVERRRYPVVPHLVQNPVNRGAELISNPPPRVTDPVTNRTHLLQQPIQGTLEPVND